MSRHNARSKNLRRHLVGCLAIVVTVASGCGGTEATPTTSADPNPSDTPATTADDPLNQTEPPTNESPTTTEAPEQDIIEVTFDGDTCTATGPSAVPAGVQSFVLEDRTDERRADIRTMAIIDDHTYQDLLDLQSASGEYVPLPDWAEWPLTDFGSVGRELADNELGKRLILEAGIHGIVVGTGKGVWFCGSLTVSE